MYKSWINYNASIKNVILQSSADCAELVKREENRKRILGLKLLPKDENAFLYAGLSGDYNSKFDIININFKHSFL